MGVFESLFHRQERRDVSGYFASLTEYTPRFTTWRGGVYEMALTQSCIEAGAVEASKLRPEVAGTAQRQATRTLAHRPNPFQTTPQFLARCFTILQCVDTCLILPVLADDLATQVGYFPAVCRSCDCYDVGGTLWLDVEFSGGSRLLIEASRVGILTRHQFRSDIFGDQNGSFDTTMDLMHAQDEAQISAIQNSATIRFIGKLAAQVRDDDIEKERSRFVARNLKASNGGGLMIYDQKFTDVKQVASKPYVIDSEQLAQIESNCFRYFGVNDKILTNSWDEQSWNAYYEGKIEPFAIQLGEALTSMTFTDYERSCGNEITLSANRLQYASNATKLQVTTELGDRGWLTGDQAMDIWQLPHFDGGDQRHIRGEYIDAALVSEHTLGGASAAPATGTDQTGVGSDAADQAKA